MFTQCPQCETVFKLSADALGAAGGQVRCGRCGEVFDSLKRLAEEPHMFVIGESTLELEARAEQILESLGVETKSEALPAEDAGASITNVENPEPAAEIDRSLEFSLTPTDLDRIFIGSVGTRDLIFSDEAPPPEEEEQLEYVERRRRHVDELPAGEEHEATPPAAADVVAFLQPDVQGQRRWPYVVAMVLLAVLLAGQVVHRNREWLASHGPLGAALRSLYADLGRPLPAPANLSGYQLRQWGASGDASANGALRVRASILNTSTQLQPFPLLRVTLEDRFGAHIGTRDFEPAEYSGKPLTRLLSPGERADATVEILDPGKNAEGFELDVCLLGADARIRCAGDSAVAPHSP